MKKYGFKRMISMILAVGMVAAMAGCGSSSTSSAGGAGADDASGSDKTKIVLLLNGYLGDLAWYDCSAAGIKAIQDTYPDEVETQVIEMTTDKSKYDSIIADTLSEDWDIVVAGSWTMMEYIEAAAEDYPEKEFWFFDEPIEGVSNVYSMSYNANEGSFLAGMAAASVSESGVIGFIGGEDSTVVNDSLVGYLEGAAYVNPDIKAIVSYTGNWDDSAKGKELALVQYNAGADVVFQLASNAGVGVFEAAKDEGFYAIGVDSDQKYIAPDVIICSMVKKVGKSIYDTVSDMENYFKGGEIWEADMATGYIDVVYGDDTMPQQVSDELKAEVEALKEKIISGEIEVPTTLE